MKLFVNLPKYRKNEGIFRKTPVTAYPVSTAAKGEKKVLKQWRKKPANLMPKQSQEPKQQLVDSNTRKGIGDDRRGRRIKTTPVNLPWLHESWVGTTYDYPSMPTIRESLLKEGLGCVKARYMGDKEVLLSASTGANMAQIVNENSLSLGKIFEFIKPWGNGTQVGSKVVWTRCRGIPL